MIGIRLKLLVGLTALMLLSLVATQVWLSWRLNRGYTQLETQAVQQQLERLLVAVDAQLLQHDKLVNDWANWTEFADYARQGRGAFARLNLNQDAVAAAGFDWLEVRGPGGQALHRVSPAGTDLDAVHASAYGDWLRQPPAPGARSCGLARWDGRWVALCRQGIRNSGGDGPPQGLLLVAEPVPADFEPHLSRLTGLHFGLSHEPLPAAAPDQRWPALGSSLGQAEPRYRLEAEHIRAWWPVHDLAGQPAGHLWLEWPRSASLQARENLGAVQWQLLGVFALITAGLLVLLDRLVVRRLHRFSQELRRIHHKERWQEQITVDGRDEITQLAQDTNNLLGLIHFQMENLELLAESDALTGLPNRRSFDGTLRRALATHKRHGRPLCLAVLDVDHFKAYNDHHGHVQGDLALQAVAQCLLAQARRPGDLPSRVGGEEFAVVLEDTPLVGGAQWLQAVQGRLAALALAHGHSPVSGCLTVSAGIVSAEPDDTPDRLYQRADAALYQAKRQGRNRVVTG